MIDALVGLVIMGVSTLALTLAVQVSEGALSSASLLTPTKAESELIKKYLINKYGASSPYVNSAYESTLASLKSSLPSIK